MVRLHNASLVEPSRHSQKMLDKDLIREWSSFFAIRVELMNFTTTGYMGMP
jgi:hypothetical protein